MLYVPADVTLYQKDFIMLCQESRILTSCDRLQRLMVELATCLEAAIALHPDNQAVFDRHAAVSSRSSASTTEDADCVLGFECGVDKLPPVTVDTSKYTRMSSLKANHFSSSDVFGDVWPAVVPPPWFAETVHTLQLLVRLVACRTERAGKVGGYEAQLQEATTAALELLCQQFHIEVSDGRAKDKLLCCVDVKIKGYTDLIFIDTRSKRVVMYCELKTRGVSGPAQAQALGAGLCLTAGLNGTPPWSTNDCGEGTGSPLGFLCNAQTVWRCRVRDAEELKFWTDIEGATGKNVATVLWQSFQAVRTWLDQDTGGGGGGGGGGYGGGGGGGGGGSDGGGGGSGGASGHGDGGPSPPSPAKRNGRAGAQGAAGPSTVGKGGSSRAGTSTALHPVSKSMLNARLTAANLFLHREGWRS
jgi:uncharacterized membrane protein YgcG